MGAPDIVRKAREAGLDIIGVADHNTCENFPGVAAAALSAGNVPPFFPAWRLRVPKIFIY